MSDNPLDVFDAVIAAMDKAAEAAKPPASPKTTPSDAAKAQSQLAKKALAAKIASFQSAAATAIAQRGCQKNWTRDDFDHVKALVAYLTSTHPVELKVRPRPPVYNSARDIFFGMLDRSDFPEGTFNGERDRKKKTDGQHVSSAAHSSRRLADAVPAELRPQGWVERRTAAGATNVVSLDNKRQSGNRKQRRDRARSAS